MTSIKVQIVQLFNKSAKSITSKLFDPSINLLIELPHQPTLLKQNKNTYEFIWKKSS
jgi:hypothetical protein